MPLSWLLVLLIGFGTAGVSAQDPPQANDTVKTEEQLQAEIRQATWGSPTITDDMTVDSDQNKKWRSGEGKFPAKPKDMWELGFHVGHFFCGR